MCDAGGDILRESKKIRVFYMNKTLIKFAKVYFYKFYICVLSFLILLQKSLFCNRFILFWKIFYCLSIDFQKYTFAKGGRSAAEAFL